MTLCGCYLPLAKEVQIYDTDPVAVEAGRSRPYKERGLHNGEGALVSSSARISHSKMRITTLFVAVLVALAAMFTATEANPTFFKNKGGGGGKGGGGKYGGGGGGGKSGGKFGSGKFGLFGGEGHLFPLFGGLLGKKG
ncbi:eggshell protein 2A-like [Penaeus chinensis]|uniref:eggshell protein 2A-like n=1 Tax=Penaeus chinensis TaxID=139456 RepID=UPI001FB7BFE4|nr:eggshell protein 2A-like [Penaeus chinensis]